MGKHAQQRMHSTWLIAAFFNCSALETTSSQRGCRRKNRKASDAHRWAANFNYAVYLLIMLFELGVIMGQSERTVVCSKCGSELKPIGSWLNRFQSTGWVTIGVSESDRQGMEQWLGTTCVQCHMVFCEKCRDVGHGSCPNCGGEIRPAAASWLPKNADKTAVRILIAHTGKSLAKEDINEILKFAWDGQISENIKITTHPLTPTAWTDDKQLAFAWSAWQQVLKHKYGEHPYWDDHKT